MEFAHEESLKAVMVNAFLGIDVLVDEEFYKQVRGGVGGEYEGSREIVRGCGELTCLVGDESKEGVWQI